MGRLVALIIAVAVVAACQPRAGETPEEAHARRVSNACASFTATYKTMAAYEAAGHASLKPYLDSVDATVGPICAPPADPVTGVREIPTGAGVLLSINNGIGKLIEAKIAAGIE